MKKHLIIYVILILVYFVYNQFIKVQNEKLRELIGIVFSSVLFLYIALIAYIILKKTKKEKVDN